MNVTQKGVLALLKAAVTQEPGTVEEDFRLEDAFALMKKHSLHAMLYDGAVRCGFSRREPVMQRLFQSYCKALLISERQMQQVSRIFAAFDSNGIDYMPVKGCEMKALYPKPEFRSMGDADILVRAEQYKKIVPIMEQLGFTEKPDSDHEWPWESETLYLELHKRLIPSYNTDFYRYFGDGWQLAKPEAGCRYSMTAEDELIYLFTHFAKHFRDGGIGCRHVMDLWIFQRQNPQLDACYVRQELETLRLQEFYDNILNLMAGWFDGQPMDEKTAFISDFIFQSGNWGAWEQKLLAQMVRSSKNLRVGKNGKLLYLCRVAFPSRETLKGKYPVLEKAPWLLPGIWVIRPVSKLFDREAMKRQEKNLKAVGGEKVSEYQQMLNYLGLDFHK